MHKFIPLIKLLKCDLTTQLEDDKSLVEMVYIDHPLSPSSLDPQGLGNY